MNFKSLLRLKHFFMQKLQGIVTVICRPIAAQFMEDDLIALFEFEEGENGVVLSLEKHYRLVPSDSVTSTDLDMYRSRSI